MIAARTQLAFDCHDRGAPQSSAREIERRGVPRIPDVTVHFTKRDTDFDASLHAVPRRVPHPSLTYDAVRSQKE